MADSMRERLRERQPRPVTVITNSEIECKKPPKTSAERSQNYYHRMKLERQDEFKDKLLAQKERSKGNRDNFKMRASEEEKEKRREKNRCRMRQWRERKKLTEITGNVKASQKPLTRQQRENIELKKQKDRERKRKEREGWSAQKRTADRKKARERYYRRKGQVANQTHPQESETDSESTDGRTGHARAQAVSRMNRALPKEDVKRQHTITDFIKHHGSTTESDAQKSLTEAILSNDGVDSQEQRLFKRILAKKLLHLPQKVQSEVVKTLKTNKKNILSMSAKSKGPLRCRRKRDLKNASFVKSFFIENSRTLPLKRHTSRKVLEDTLINLYEKFSNQGHTSVSFSFFCSYRPKRIKTQQFTKFNQSLCEVCENVELKIKAVNKAAGETIIKNKQKLLEILLCRKSGPYFKKACLEQKCDLCGFKNIDSLIKQEWLEREIEVREWGMKEVRRGENIVKKKVLLRNDMTLSGLLQVLKESITSFPMHNFYANWQYAQYNNKKKHLRQGELLAVLDFAENYRCSSQDEAQAAHWNYCQATVHPIVFNYKCSCSDTICESVVIISDDLNHDSAAVQVFTEKALQHIQTRGTFHRLIQFTDGCAAQYKSKQPFMDLQTGFKSYDLSVERNFFGSRHGKGPADGESAVVKSGATRAVKSRRALIQNAQDVYEFCNSSMAKDGPCVHFRRKFLYIQHCAIERQRRTQNKSSLVPVKGTRAIHTIKSQDGKLYYRNLSCFCAACESGGSGEECGPYAEEWQEHSMLVKANQVKPQTQREEDNLNSSLPELSTSTLNYLDDLEQNERGNTGEESTTLVPKTNTPIAKQAGSWVVAKFPGKSMKTYLGMVMNSEDGEANVKFCRRNGRYFTWPLIEDIGWMPHYALTPIDPPIMDARERLFVSEDNMTLF